MRRTSFVAGRGAHFHFVKVDDSESGALAASLASAVVCVTHVSDYASDALDYFDAALHGLRNVQPWTG